MILKLVEIWAGLREFFFFGCLYYFYCALGKKEEERRYRDDTERYQLLLICFSRYCLLEERELGKWLWQIIPVQAPRVNNRFFPATIGPVQLLCSVSRLLTKQQRWQLKGAKALTRRFMTS